MKIKCIKDGKLRVALRGVDFRDDYDNRLPIYVKYTKLMIDEEDVIEALMMAHKIRPERYTILGDNGISKEAAYELAHNTEVI